MSLILTIETSGQICSVALFEKNQLIDSREIMEQGAHSAKLTLLIQEVLKKNNYSIKNLKAVGISIGPGSYTGLRIGLSTAKGICFGLDIPLISISTLRIMMEEVKLLKTSDYYLSMMDARRMEVYAAIFNKNGETILEEGAYILTENPFENYLEKNIIVYGNGANKWDWTKENLERFIENISPRAKFMGNLVYEKFLNKNFEDLVLSEPAYLKEYQGK
ncbi:MAG: hypothetical protein RIR51_1848 [Bacteroidota bacterium]|jgi:tRNA threonylcarbamoyladenosine biosynthesis protein TsaB